MKKILIIQSAVISMLFAVIGMFVYVDIWPSFHDKYFSKKYIDSNVSDSAYVGLCYNKTLDMLSNESLDIQIYDDNSFMSRYRRWKYNKNSASDKEHNYYKNYLALGILKCNEPINLEVMESLQRQTAVEKFSHVTHVINSWLAVELYKKTKDEGQIKTIRKGLDYLYSAMDSDSLIHYWNNNLILVDGLGMYIPFLVSYYQTFGDEKALRLAQLNFDYFMNHGTSGHLPHWFINNNMGIGPNNWGRGISWYILGLLSLSEIEEKYKMEAKVLADNLLKLQSKPFIWNQLVGIEAYSTFDSTATIPILLLINKVYPELVKENLSQIMYNLKSITLEDGTVMAASGDSSMAPYLNRSKGSSEFAQGMLLWLLAGLNI